MGPLAIVPARADDAPVLSGLMRRAIRRNNAADYPPDVIERILAWHSVAAVKAMIATRRVFVAVEPSRIVGTIALEGPVLRGLFVDVDRQGRGLARWLVAEVEAIARASGIPELALQSSVTAHGFYERLGYRTQAFRFRPQGSTYRMVKALAPVPLVTRAPAPGETLSTRSASGRRCGARSGSRRRCWT